MGVEAKAGIYKDISDAARGVTQEISGVAKDVAGVGREILNRKSSASSRTLPKTRRLLALTG